VLALTCLWATELPQFTQLVMRLGLTGILGTYVLLVGVFAVAALILDFIMARVPSPPSLSAIRGGEIVRNLALASKMMAIFAVATLLHKAPDFVYKAF
jgi:hypothetical protein